jgi:hypothetical protein
LFENEGICFICFLYGNFKNVSFKINNKDEAAKNVALKAGEG